MPRNPVKKITKVMFERTNAGLYFGRCKLRSIPLRARLNWNSVPGLNPRLGKRRLRLRLLGSAAPTFPDFWDIALCGVRRWFLATNWLAGVATAGE